MKLCSYVLVTPLGDVSRVGVVVDDGIIDATLARTAMLERILPTEAACRVASAQVPSDMIELIGSGPQALYWVQEAVEHVLTRGVEATSRGHAILHRPSNVRLIAPIPRPPGIACFVTWRAHIEDSRDKGFSMLQFPDPSSDMRAYYKANPDAVDGPNTVIPRPAYASETDVECEMAAVVGVGGKDLSIDEAARSIVGYTIFNDVSYRDIQRKEMAFGLGPTKGKDADQSNVLGPWLVTPDEVGDPQNLSMHFTVNGEIVASCRTSDMAWGFADLVSYLSRGQTLRPGQVVTSGAFPGGSALDANLQLRSGDVVEMRIERLGSLVSTLA